jgi:outer membrane protein assembly factor BamB
VKRVPIVVLSVLVAMMATAGIVRLRARRPPLADPRGAVVATMPSAEASTTPHGLGAGPPPAGITAFNGARTVHGEPRRTGRVAAHAPLVAPAVLWKHDIGGAIEAQVATSADEGTLYVASLSGALVALARDDGAERWRLALGDRAYATPCVADDGTVYAGSDAKKLYAVSPDGRVKWTFDTDGDADTGPAIASDGTVVLAAGRMVYGVRPGGVLAWRFAAKRKVFTAPALGPTGRVFVGSQDHHAYALDAGGRLAWSVDLGADVDGSPAVGDDGGVYFGTDGDEVVRLGADDGRVVWRARVGGYVRGALSVARDGDVLAGVYGPAPRQLRLRASDGSVVGALPIQGTGAREYGVHGGAIEDEAGTLLFGAQDDHVYAVDAVGTLLWTFATGGDVDAPLTLLTDGSLAVGSDDGSVYLLR